MGPRGRAVTAESMFSVARFAPYNGAMPTNPTHLPIPWALILTVILLITYAALLRFDAWGYIGVPHLVPEFLDFHALLSASDCHQLGIDVYRTNPCDATGRPMMYSKLWLYLGDLGLTREHNPVIGFSLGAVFLSVAASIANPKNTLELVVSTVVVLSPAVMLGVERGNNDLIVFLCIALAAVILGRSVEPRPLRFGGAFVMIWVAAFLKFYPIAGLALIIDRLRSPGQFVLFIALSLLAFTLFVVAQIDELLILVETAPAPLRRWTFGARLFFVSLGLDQFSRAGIPLMGFLSAGLALGVGWRLRVAMHVVTPPDRSLFVASVALLVGCFFVTTNYDYRGVFFIGTLPTLFALWRGGCTDRFSRVFVAALLAGLVVVLWAEIFVDWLALARGQPHATFLIADRHLYPAVRVPEHSITWLVLIGMSGLTLRILALSPLGRRVCAALTSLRAVKPALGDQRVNRGHEPGG